MMALSEPRLQSRAPCQLFALGEVRSARHLERTLGGVGQGHQYSGTGSTFQTHPLQKLKEHGIKGYVVNLVCIGVLSAYQLVLLTAQDCILCFSARIADDDMRALEFHASPLSVEASNFAVQPGPH